MVTLDQVREELKEANLRLDEIDDRFLQFFRENAANKLDMLEMMRELKRQQAPSPKEQASDDNIPDTPKGDSKFGGFLKALGIIGATFAALELNAMGAVGSLRMFADDMKAKIPDSFKTAGAKVSEFASKVKNSIVSTITESKIFKKGAEAVEKGKGLVSTGVEKAKAVGSNFISGAKNLVSSGLDKARAATTGAISGAQNLISSGVEKASAVGSKIKGGVQALGQTAAGKAIVSGAKVAARGVNRVLVPLSLATSAAEGYSMAQETPEMSTAGKLAVGAGGAASAFFGGFADFVKNIAVDAPIELLQKSGLADEKGYLQRIQDVSIQRDISDALVREIRDGVRRLATDEVGKRSLQGVAERGTVNIINNTNAPTTTQNNVTTMMGDDRLPNSLNSNGTRASAY